MRFRKLRDLDPLVRRNVAKDLGCPARRPVHFQNRDPISLAQADRLLQRVGAEAASRRDMPVDCQRIFAACDHLDPCSDRGPVRLPAHQLYCQPVVTLSGILKQDVVILVAVDGAASLDEDVDVAVAVPVAAGHAVSLLKVACAARCR